MPYFAVTQRWGPAWDSSRTMDEQEAWAEHAAFMDGLVDDGFIVLGGPLDDGPDVLLIVEAESEDAVQSRLDADPWKPIGMLQLVDVRSWWIRLGTV